MADVKTAHYQMAREPGQPLRCSCGKTFANEREFVGHVFPPDTPPPLSGEGSVGDDTIDDLPYRRKVALQLLWAIGEWQGAEDDSERQSALAGVDRYLRRFIRSIMLDEQNEKEAPTLPTQEVTDALRGFVQWAKRTTDVDYLNGDSDIYPGDAWVHLDELVLRAESALRTGERP